MDIKIIGLNISVYYLYGNNKFDSGVKIGYFFVSSFKAILDINDFTEFCILNNVIIAIKQTLKCICYFVFVNIYL